MAAEMRRRGFEPLAPYPGVGKLWPCRCLVCGREYEVRYSNVRAGQGCGFCAGNRVDPAEAIEVMLAAGYEPLEDYPGALEPWRCRCTTCGRESTPRRMHVLRGSRCIYCVGKRRVDDEEAAVAMLEAGFEVLCPFPGADTPWPSRCTSCGREVAPRWSNVRKGVGCKYCKSKVVDRDEVYAAMRAAGFEPLAPFTRSIDPWLCRCVTCGRESTPRHSAVKQGGSSCAFCAGQRVDPLEAVATMRAAGLEPLTEYPGSEEPWKCRCVECGNEVFPRWGNAKRGQQGCGYCARRSFIGKPAWIYVVFSEEHGAVKVGIARRHKRVENWARAGWELIKEWRVADGATAVAAEGAILRWWREGLGAPFGTAAADLGVMAGYTETAPLWAVDLDETVARIEELLRDSEGLGG